MKFPALQAALEMYFGEDVSIGSPEDESDAWKDIVNDLSDGAFAGMHGDLIRLLGCSDAEIFEFLRAVAPAWECSSAGEARHGLLVFKSYVETYSR